MGSSWPRRHPNLVWQRSFLSHDPRDVHRAICGHAQEVAAGAGDTLAVDALPLVGYGAAYRAVTGVTILGPSQTLPSGG